MPTDAELLLAWRDGDRRAGRQLFDRHVQSVSRFLRTKVADQDREELLQDVFASCLGPDVELRGASFRTYILRAAKNRVINFYVKRGRHRARFDPMAESAVDLCPSPTAELARHQQERVLLRGLRSLPLDLQILLELYYWESFSVSQLAEVLEIPPGTVKTRLFRARRLLREVLERSETDPALVQSTIDRIDEWAQALRESLRDPGDEAAPQGDQSSPGSG